MKPVFFRPSPTRPSSPSRTRGCSRRCRRGRAMRQRPCSIKRQQATCSRPSAGRQQMLSLCSRQIAQSAARLCNAHFCNVFRFDGHLIHFAASYGASAEFRNEKRTQSPVVPSRGFAAARAILDNAVTEIADLRADPDFDHWRIASVADYRSVLAVPMRKDGLPIGAIAVVRSQIGAFPKRQIELLKTFADQAVIAIENTRLFEAEQASKRELTEALEQQTATADVLKVI